MSGTNIPFTYVAAETYSCGTYGANAYGECPATSSDLAGTGYDILVPIFLGISLIVASVVLMVRRALRKRIARNLPIK